MIHLEIGSQSIREGGLWEGEEVSTCTHIVKRYNSGLKVQKNSHHQGLLTEIERSLGEGERNIASLPAQPDGPEARLRLLLYAEPPLHTFHTNSQIPPRPFSNIHFKEMLS